MARRDSVGIRLLTRNGHDWSPRYPLIVEAMNRLKARSCLIDGEAVACDENGLAVFEQLRRKPSGKHVFLYAFDLLELDGQDGRREPLETRKATLESLLRGSLPGLRLNEHLAHELQRDIEQADFEGRALKNINHEERRFLQKTINELSVDEPAMPTQAQARWLLAIKQWLSE
jgi:ATP-dependent DNA ligase